MYGQQQFYLIAGDAQTKSSSLERGESVHTEVLSIHAAMVIQMPTRRCSQMGSKTRKSNVSVCVRCHSIFCKIRNGKSPFESQLTMQPKDSFNTLRILISLETKNVKLKARAYSALARLGVGNRIHRNQSRHSIKAKTVYIESI